MVPSWCDWAGPESSAPAPPPTWAAPRLLIPQDQASTSIGWAWFMSLDSPLTPSMSRNMPTAITLTASFSYWLGAPGFRLARDQAFPWLALREPCLLTPTSETRRSLRKNGGARNNRPAKAAELTAQMRCTFSESVSSLFLATAHVQPEGAKAVKVQDRRLMPRHGLLRVVGQMNPLQGHSAPIGDVREVASMEGRDRVESLGGLEVAAAAGVQPSKDAAKGMGNWYIGSRNMSSLKQYMKVRNQILRRARHLD